MDSLPKWSPCIHHPAPPQEEEAVSTGQGGRRGVRLCRGRRSSGFEGKCAYGLGKPRKGCGGDLTRVPGDGGRQGAPRAVACRSALRSFGGGWLGCARAPARGPGERRCRLIRRFIWIFFFFSAGVSIMERLSSIVHYFFQIYLLFLCSKLKTISNMCIYIYTLRLVS
jgi:hypothetical protein